MAVAAANRDIIPLNPKGIRVLVVADEPDAREKLQQILEHCGTEALAVSSAAEALKAL